MTGRLILVSLLGYIAGVLSLAGAIVIGARFRSRDDNEESPRPRGKSYLQLDSGELLALLLRGGGSSTSTERSSGSFRRSSGRHLMS